VSAGEPKAQKQIMPPSLATRRLVIVSNRLPFSVTIDKSHFSFQSSAGGLATGLASYLDSRKQPSAAADDYLWVGWPGTTVDAGLQPDLTREALDSFQSQPVFLSATEMEQFYFGFCNATIWPLFHYFSYGSTTII
jgi:trehalose 6-phosphate synthase/phosphatase